MYILMYIYRYVCICTYIYMYSTCIRCFKLKTPKLSADKHGARLLPLWRLRQPGAGGEWSPKSDAREFFTIEDRQIDR